MDADSDANPAAGGHAHAATADIPMIGDASRRSRWTVAATLVVALAAATLGESTVAAAQLAVPRVEISASRVEGPNLAVSVALVDAGGNPVTGLVADNFSASIDGAAARIVSLDPGVDSALPLGIVVALDTSGSMAGESIVAAKLALTNTVAALRPGDSATFVTFAQSVTTVVAPTEDHAALQAAIAGVPAVGNTALFAGVTSAAASSASLSQPRKAVVLLSDGEDFGNVSGGITREQALANAKASATPFFVVGLGREVDQAFLIALAESTGGQYFAAAEPAELAQLYARISERLRQQYTMLVELPGALAPGNHRLRIRYGTQSAETAFVTSGESTVLESRFSPIPAVFNETILVTLIDAPTGANARFTIDGQVARSEPNGKSIRLDPYSFEPGKPHTLEVAFFPDGIARATSTTFTAAALPPQLLEPKSLPGLRAGDLVRLRVLAQPGAVTVTYVVDGIEVERDVAPPFEFVLPAADYSPGEHELTVTLGGTDSSSSVSFTFPGAEESGGSPVLILGLLLLLAAALATTSVIVVRRWVARRQRSTPVATTRDLPAELDSWVQSGRRSVPRESAPAAEPQVQGTWGTLRVLEGPDSGKSFQLSSGTELVGRGKFCTVRLSDKSLHEAHFIIENDGRLVPSSPSAAVSVDDGPPGPAPLRHGSKIRAGSTILEFGRLAGSDRTPDSPASQAT